MRFGVLVIVVAVLLAAGAVVWTLLGLSHDVARVADELNGIARNVNAMSDDVRSLADDVNAIADALAGEEGDEDDQQQSTTVVPPQRSLPRLRNVAHSPAGERARRARGHRLRAASRSDATIARRASRPAP
jgi:hypothetical protein